MAYGRSIERLLALLCVLGIASTGCTKSGSSTETPGEGQGEGASCALRVELNGVSYSEIANIPVEIAEKAGTGNRLGCSDSDRNDPVREVTLYRIRGVRDAVMVASNSPHKLTLYLAEGKEVPSKLSTPAR